jgi:hypothetical protein
MATSSWVILGNQPNTTHWLLLKPAQLLTNLQSSNQTAQNPAPSDPPHIDLVLCIFHRSRLQLFDRQKPQPAELARLGAHTSHDRVLHTIRLPTDSSENLRDAVIHELTTLNNGEFHHAQFTDFSQPHPIILRDTSTNPTLAILLSLQSPTNPHVPRWLTFGRSPETSSPSSTIHPLTRSDLHARADPPPHLATGPPLTWPDLDRIFHRHADCRASAIRDRFQSDRRRTAALAQNSLHAALLLHRPAAAASSQGLLAYRESDWSSGFYFLSLTARDWDDGRKRRADDFVHADGDGDGQSPRHEYNVVGQWERGVLVMDFQAHSKGPPHWDRDAPEAEKVPSWLEMLDWEEPGRFALHWLWADETTAFDPRGRIGGSTMKSFGRWMRYAKGEVVEDLSPTKARRFEEEG